MTDTILRRPGWPGLGGHCGVMSGVYDDGRVQLVGVAAGGTNRVTDTIFGGRERSAWQPEEKAISGCRVLYVLARIFHTLSSLRNGCLQATKEYAGPGNLTGVKARANPRG
ncbi:MAG: hypothetical protein GX456_03745 [Verrucomicrobia bacterium]|nr:hypothetical protein [Verrucomicrobiota bacterium]